MRYISLLLLSLTLMTSHAETLTIATPRFMPPYVMAAGNQNHYIGFSIDIILTICKRMKVTCNIKSMPLTDTFDAIIKKEVDLAIGNYLITPDREAHFKFSLPYLQSEAAFITLVNNPMTSMSNLKTKSVGALARTVLINYLEKKFGSDIKIVPYPNISEMMLALSEGKVDAIIIDRKTANFWLGNNYDMFKMLGQPFPLGIGIGIMANKDNTPLITRVNQALLRMQADGYYLKIYSTYFFSDTKKVESKKVESKMD